MDQDRTAQQMIAERTVAGFLAAAARMANAHPHPNGPTIRLTATIINGGADLGAVDIDVTNLWDLGNFANRRAANLLPTTQTTAPSGRPNLHLVGGDA